MKELRSFFHDAQARLGLKLEEYKSRALKQPEQHVFDKERLNDRMHDLQSLLAANGNYLTLTALDGTLITLQNTYDYDANYTDIRVDGSTFSLFLYKTALAWSWNCELNGSGVQNAQTVAATQDIIETCINLYEQNKQMLSGEDLFNTYAGEIVCIRLANAPTWKTGRVGTEIWKSEDGTDSIYYFHDAADKRDKKTTDKIMFSQRFEMRAIES